MSVGVAFGIEFDSIVKIDLQAVGHNGNIPKTHRFQQFSPHFSEIGDGKVQFSLRSRYGF